MFFIFYFCLLHAQTLGGSATYNFLKLPASPLLSAVGGENISYASNDVGLSVNNPALLKESFHGQIALNFNSYFAATKAYSVTGAYHQSKWNTTFGSQVFFIDYGSIPQTNSGGEEEGKFRPKDFVFQLSASRNYLEKWRYGMNLKFIHSDYGQYRSTGIAADMGIHFIDSARNFSAGLLAKNMGAQLATYNGQNEDLPFDLQVGITQKLSKAPFGFSITAQHLQQFNTVYNDTIFNNENDFASDASFGNKLFNHFIIATHIYIGKNLEANIGYNRLRRNELNLGNAGNGLNGFSAGLKASFNKLHIQYARAYFGRGVAYNQFGINLQLNEISGIGKL
jgi:hypothetical protein